MVVPLMTMVRFPACPNPRVKDSGCIAASSAEASRVHAMETFANMFVPFLLITAIPQSEK